MNVAQFEAFIGMPFAILLSFTLQPIFLRTFYSEERGGGEWKMDILTKFSTWFFVAVCIGVVVFAMSLVDQFQIKRLLGWSALIVITISVLFNFVFKILTAVLIPYRVINFLLVIITWVYFASQLVRWI